ncbi:hypothetical protein [Microvirga sp. KLBC 81]|uniref:hypothetical protein n=1 Tax=Microvirga sp. KLBC 81 TaxID=1862707 RepID=UPI001058049F|nr:hypothetical protein [Microvirga sp. KLBC 81]
MLSGYINSAQGAVIGRWRLNGRRLSGWAAHVSGQSEPVVIDLTIQRKRRKIVCDTFWTDSLPSQISHRFVGFEYIVDDESLQSDDVSLQIRIGRKDYKSPVMVVPAASYNRTQLHIDSIEDDVISGWAWSPLANNDEPVSLIIDNRQFFAWPTEYRQDLFETGYAAGACSFRLDLRQAAGPVTAKVIRATYRDVSKEITIGQSRSGFHRISGNQLISMARFTAIPQPRYLITV